MNPPLFDFVYALFILDYNHNYVPLLGHFIVSFNFSEP